MKVAFVVQRYGLEINGGAELHCRWVAEHMTRFWEVEVLTTRAFDYITWKNHYPRGEEVINGIPVRRFSVDRPRHPERFGRLQKHILANEHTEEEELRWLEEEGPLSTELIDYIKRHRNEYDYFIFFSYRYYHSFHGIQAVPDKSVLVPTAEHDPVIHLPVFKGLFRLPRAFVYNSHEERRLIQDLSGNRDIPGDVVGVGSEVPEETHPREFRARHGLDTDYLLYIGRIDENKGCHELFDHFLRFKADTGSPLKLVLMGSTILKIPAHPDILYLGFVDESAKFSGLAGAMLLAMPSFYESLSMVTLEAWAMGKPVLANARCEVLKGQCLRSDAGLFYDSYSEFRDALSLLAEDPRLRDKMGENGRRYYQDNYTWDVIEGKYRKIIDRLEKEGEV